MSKWTEEEEEEEECVYVCVCVHLLAAGGHVDEQVPEEGMVYLLPVIIEDLRDTQHLIDDAARNATELGVICAHEGVDAATTVRRVFLVPKVEGGGRKVSRAYMAEGLNMLFLPTLGKNCSLVCQRRSCRAP